MLIIVPADDVEIECDECGDSFLVPFSLLDEEEEGDEILCSTCSREALWRWIQNKRIEHHTPNAASPWTNATRAPVIFDRNERAANRSR